jgi:glyoxylase-like metal-dependent hydrolase (beta-lactamase superfamily II)
MDGVARSESIARKEPSMIRPLAALALVLLTPLSAAAAPKLALDVYTADAGAFGVTSAVIFGPTEAVLIDAQFRNSDADKLAARIRSVAPGRKLKAIVVTHAHPDHYFGATRLLEHFPGTPVYLSAAGIEEFKQSVDGKLAFWGGVYGSDVPKQVAVPQPSPQQLTVDGETLEIVSGIQGDVQAPSNSYVWIPSLGALVASDLVYSGTHVWLADSDAASRRGWNAALTAIESKHHPRVVVAGHKARPQGENSPADIAFVRRYIEDFDRLRVQAQTDAELIAAMRAAYPDLALTDILGFAAKAAFAH